MRLFDPWFRYCNLTSFFPKGFGNPNDLKRLFAFRKLISNRVTCQHLVSPDHDIKIDKKQQFSDATIIEGHFTSPFVHILPGVMPKEAETARFQMVLPKNENQWHTRWGSDLRPVCIHMAGTGDHGFAMRQRRMAKPLLKDVGIGSILLENPFYGTRKPKAQLRSSLQTVSDLFVMGGALVLEALALYHWCEKRGYGPLGLTGISMGGHNASLAACAWPKPVPLVPCLSWTSASLAFTRGMLSTAVSWDVLEAQYNHDKVYQDELTKYIYSPEDNIGGDMAKTFIESQKIITETDANSMRYFEEMEQLCKMNMNDPTNPIILNSRGDLGAIRADNTVIHKSSRIRNLFSRSNLTRDTVSKGTMDFMRHALDECTHFANYCTPIDTDLIVIIAATGDKYYPRENAMRLTDVWPGSELRYIDTDHIGGFLLHGADFRKAIVDSFDRYINKYHFPTDKQMNAHGS